LSCVGRKKGRKKKRKKKRAFLGSELFGLVEKEEKGTRLLTKLNCRKGGGGKRRRDRLKGWGVRVVITLSKILLHGVGGKKEEESFFAILPQSAKGKERKVRKGAQYSGGRREKRVPASSSITSFLFV